MICALAGTDAGCGSDGVQSLDHWDMRTGRNMRACLKAVRESLDHWDMRTGRNWGRNTASAAQSLDHWDMRTGRNKV